MKKNISKKEKLVNDLITDLFLELGSSESYIKQLLFESLMKKSIKALKEHYEEP